MCDTALDFLLRVLPAMPVPPMDGVKDGIIYQLSDLSLQGLKIKKEFIQVEIAGISANKEAGKLLGTSNLNHDADMNGEPSNKSDAEEPVTSSMIARELLIIDVQNIFALLENVKWSVEQTYFPRLESAGTAFVELQNSSIRLVFELRKKLKSDKKGDKEEWEPVLCLNKRLCNIADIDLKLSGSSLSWVLNLGASIFKTTLRAYVMQTVLNALESNSGFLLQQLNGALKQYWGIIMRTAELNMVRDTKIESYGFRFVRQ